MSCSITSLMATLMRLMASLQLDDNTPGLGIEIT